MNDEMGERTRQFDFESVIVPDFFEGNDFAGAIHVALHKVAAQTITDGKGALKIHDGPHFEIAEIGDPQGFMKEIKTGRSVFDFGNRQARTISGDTFTDGEFVNEARPNLKPRSVFDRFNGGDFACFFNDTCEHVEHYRRTLGKSRSIVRLR